MKYPASKLCLPFLYLFLAVITLPSLNGFVQAEETAVDYQKLVQPLLNKYCSNCHSDADKEGGFSSESYLSLQAGIKGKPVFLSGDVAGSLLLRVLDKNAETAMPPEDEPQPTAEEIAILKSWVEAGAKGPKGMQPNRLKLNVPELPAKPGAKPVTAIANSKTGLLAVGRFTEVNLYRPQINSAKDGTALEFSTPLLQIKKLPGKVNALDFSANGTLLAIASGVSGRGGMITIYDLKAGKKLQQFAGHLDLIYDLKFSPTGKQVATCSYDKSVFLWDIFTGKQVQSFPGHNGSVYNLGFSPDGRSLITSSADDTCKVWRVKDGVRLDTLGQPLLEEYACGFSPNGKLLAAVGADKKLRIWKHVSVDKPKINPQIYARFAHQAVVSHLIWRDSGTHLVTFAENGVIKLWETKQFREVFLWDEKQKGVISAVATNGNQFYVARLDGSVAAYRFPEAKNLQHQTETENHVASHLPETTNKLTIFNEKEPNQLPTQALQISLPAEINGKIQGSQNGKSDFDLFRFSAKKGEEWLLEVRAARDKSSLDSLIEILDSNGNKLKRLNLQAVRESYFTFRGKNSSQTTDFRIFNWTEMKLNEFLYANGEVTRFFDYPRGADSGFNVYPATGNRWGYFDTTPLSHALGEPCYVVQPIAIGNKIVPNGLPVFPIYYENDDASRRDVGSDSRLFFTAPQTEDYYVKISDVRGNQGDKFDYKLNIRVPQRNFAPKILSEKLTLSPGARQEYQIGITRLEGFEGSVKILCTQKPDGVQVTSPLIIEAGQLDTEGIISVAENTTISKDAAKQFKFIAQATIDGKLVERPLAGFKEIKGGGAPKLALKIVPSPSGRKPLSAPGADLLEFVISPGETILLKVVAKRNDFKGPIPFGKEDSGRNMPFGTFVDNIGLNGLMITDKNTEREFFITCDSATKFQSRLFHIRTTSAGGHTSQPVMLHVRESK